MPQFVTSSESGLFSSTAPRLPTKENPVYDRVYIATHAHLRRVLLTTTPPSGHPHVEIWTKVSLADLFARAEQFVDTGATVAIQTPEGYFTVTLQNGRPVPMDYGDYTDYEESMYQEDIA